MVATAADTGRAPRDVDRRVALRLGMLVPGAGHFYAGEPWRGAVFLTGASGSLILGRAIYRMDACSFHLFDPGCQPHHASLRLVGGLLMAHGVVMWAFGAYDAPRAAARTNARRRQLRVAPLVTPPDRGAGPPGLAVVARWQ